MDSLQALGVSVDAEAIYLDLIEHGESTTTELAQRRGHTETELQPWLDELTAIALVDHREDKVGPRPPQLALEAYAQRHARQAELARQSATKLTELWSAGAGQRRYLEILPGFDAARTVLNSAFGDAGERVRAMTIGNQATARHRIVDGLFEALERGIDLHVIYGAHVLEDPESLHKIQHCVDAGEQARVFPHIPLNVTIVDDRWALVSARSEVQLGSRHTVAAVVVHQSPFLEGLVGVFDAFWRMAVPLSGDSDGPTSETRRLLTYLSAGLTDESIARELGVSERTIARRISRLQDTLGAKTRFQLGVQAARQGWL
ncbi:helix-turn-helix transcriptional regulator [Kutzneria chonburiensis]|uniref:LuxR C-terminal-related transcriptional regulator n=1 Tax=Kutzneria chonburiensis TaxID=1483604 RepID=A0ABV6MSC1_9PSEU|nr:helix-turn-helix transcriptional regulator [Kutzneria chonburiensis]